MVLPVTLVHHDHEAPIDFVARLAVANGFASLRDFLDHTDTSARAIVSGDTCALSNVSEWSGVPMTRLAGWSVTSNGVGATWRIGCATLSRDMRVGRRMRFCAKCVLEDRNSEKGRLAARAYRRVWWFVRGIEGCHLHDCAMAEVAVDQDIDLLDFPSFVSSNLKMIEKAAATTTPSCQPMLDRFLVDRILGVKEEGLLHSLEAHVAVEFSRYLGEFLRRHDVTEWLDQSTNVTEAGFKLAYRDKAEIQRVFRAVIDKERPTTQYVEPFLGPMVLWLRRNFEKASYQPVIDLIQDVMERHMPFGEGQVILRPVSKRYLYCVNSANAEFGMSKERIRALVSANDPGFRDGLVAASTYFDAAKFSPILLAATETLTSSEVAQIIGLREQRVRDLLKAKILPQVEERCDDLRNYSRIRKCDLDDLTTRLTECMVAVPEDAGMLSLSTASRAWGRQFHVLLTMILEKSLQAFAVEGPGHVLTRVRVKPDGLNVDGGCLAGGTEELMRLKEVERAIGSTGGTVSELIERGYLRATTERRETGRIVKFVVRQSLLELDRKYISLSAISKSRQGFRARIKEELDALDIAPIYEPSGFNARFYDRSELQRRGFSF